MLTFIFLIFALCAFAAATPATDTATAPSDTIVSVIEAAAADTNLLSQDTAISIDVAALIDTAVPVATAVPYTNTAIVYDTVAVSTGAASADTVALSDTVRQVFEDSEKRSAWSYPILSQVLFLVISIAVILTSLFFFFRKRDTRRFLTTMRLSVLDRTVQKACRYIEAHFSDTELTAAEVCAALVTGEAYLDALFVQEMGVNVQDFITQVRVNGIKFFLAERRHRDVEKVCLMCGFADKLSAEKQFIRFCGMGIGDYVKSVSRK